MTIHKDLEFYTTLIKFKSPKFVVGFDETGNGAVAGPLCVGACALPLDFAEEVKDSKRYTEKARQEAYEMITRKAASFRVFFRYPLELAEHGHAHCLNSLYQEALSYMYSIYGDDAIYILDGNRAVPSTDVPHSVLVKADDFVPAVSAASIVAKVKRDLIVTNYAVEEYEFEKHKGYPTPSHMHKLEELGPVEGIHRTNVKMVQKALAERGWYKRNNEAVEQD